LNQVRNSFMDMSSRLLHDIAVILGRDDLKIEPSLFEPVIVDFSIDTIPIVLIHSPLAQGERIFLICRFGALPEENQVTILERLLQVNFALSSQPISFSIDPETKEVLLTVHYSLKEISAQSLISSMRLASEQALLWRETHFLNEDSMAKHFDHLSTLA
jgi:hypothetical protein